MPTKKGAINLYTDDEKRAALRLGARIGLRAAARELGTYPASIRRFREQMPEFWSELVAAGEVGPERRRRTAESLEDLADAYVDREFSALEVADRLLEDDELDAKGLAALMRAMGASRGLATAGARGYRGEDVQTVEHNINFAALEMAAQAILERAQSPALPPIQVENVAQPDE